MFLKVTDSLAAIDGFQDSSLLPVVPNRQNDETENFVEQEELEEALLFRLIETKPPVQFGLNGKNLDHIYSGHKASEYGLALRKWIYGVDGLAYAMILPSKNMSGGRVCASKESMLTFFRKKSPKFLTFRSYLQNECAAP